MTNPKLYSSEELDTCVGFNVINLGTFEQQFFSASTLFTVLSQNDMNWSDDYTIRMQITDWRLVAARDAALSIYHFGKALHAIRSFAGASKQYGGKLNAVELKKVKILFDQNFPDITSMRHAISHAGELAENPRVYAEHVLKENAQGDGFFIAAGASQGLALNGVNLSIPWRGKMITVGIGQDTADTLALVRQGVSDALSGKFTGSNMNR